ncbi:MAG: hypothetical protein AB1941_01915 [Gemmatimonadota bacterium]
MTYEDFTEAVLGAVKKHMAQRVVVPGAAAAEEEVVRYIEAAPPRTGRPRRQADGTVSRSSAPGEAPAEGSGAYTRSWTSDTEAEDRGDEVAASAYSAMQSEAGIPLGVDLELGISVEPRPHIGPAMPAIAARVQDLVSGGGA